MAYLRTRPPFLDELLEAVTSELEPLAQGRARAMAYGIVARVLGRFERTQIYLPDRRQLAREARDRALILAWRAGGYRSYRELGAAFGITGAHAARVVKFYAPSEATG
ncbi:MAG: hypothetical protein JXM75_10890 [Chromatiaceae bacterium]|nr:hypothetical protein [Chromatiaceae bacterium]